MKKSILIALAFVLFLGALLRFWQMADYPVSLSIDEVAIGYNAYSILKTARDEHSQFLPLTFRSIGDYKPPVLIYLMTPAIALFGLSEFGIRLTVAFLGTLTILFVYLLTKELIKNEFIALLSSFSLAISPWHIQFSRATFEAILALFFLIIGTWIFLREIKRKGKWFWLSAIFFSLAMYSYHAERLIVPLLVAGTALIYKDKLFRNRKGLMTAIMAGVIFTLPLIFLLLGAAGKTRLANVFISRDYSINSQLHGPSDQLSLVQKVLDNNPLILINFWFKRYLDYWDPSFLFFKGMNLTFPSAPGVGLFHLFEIVPFLIGVGMVFFTNKVVRGEERLFLGFWWLVGPLAASLANNPQHPLRSLTTIPVPQIIVGIGGFWILTWLKSKGFVIKALGVFAMIVIVVVSLVYYGDIYYIHSPVHYSEYWGYGMEEVAKYAWENKDSYSEIVIDPVFGTKGPDTVGVPYLYVLVYSQYDPFLFQNSVRRRVKNEDSVDFANFTFRSIYWPKDRYQKGGLFIGSPWSLPPQDLSSQQIKKEIRFKNGALGFLVVEATESAKARKN